MEDYIKGKERERGYLHVMTPCIGTVNLYKTSGHWDHYRENMFPAMEMEGESYVLRPMNCPHHMMIYANQPHSYRQLPIRIGEIAHDFRYESSGTLKGIERGRHFCQNDAHLFCTPEQIKSEVANVCALISTSTRTSTSRIIAVFCPCVTPLTRRNTMTTMLCGTTPRTPCARS